MTTPAKIAVVGATGRVGRHVVDVLEERGYEVAPLSRATGVDVVTGAGLADALAGVSSVVDVTTGPSPEQEAATAFFLTSARNLHQAGERAGVERLVGISIIGADRFTGGYGVAKIAHEQAMLAGPLPVAIVRAAQFHEFVAQMMEWGNRGNVIYVPKMRTQLVAARAVAEMLADLAVDAAPTPAPGTPGAPEIAGPRAENLADMARLLAARRGETATIEAVNNPDDPDDPLYEAGALLPGPSATLAGPTFAEWLDAAA